MAVPALGRCFIFLADLPSLGCDFAVLSVQEWTEYNGY